MSPAPFLNPDSLSLPPLSTARLRPSGPAPSVSSKPSRPQAHPAHTLIASGAFLDLPAGPERSGAPCLGPNFVHRSGVGETRLPLAPDPMSQSGSRLSLSKPHSSPAGHSRRLRRPRPSSAGVTLPSGACMSLGQGWGKGQDRWARSSFLPFLYPSVCVCLCVCLCVGGAGNGTQGAQEEKSRDACRGVEKALC